MNNTLRPASIVALILLAGCAFSVPLQEPEQISQQERRVATIQTGVSTREEVEAALGTPWLRSQFWRFDLYRAQDVTREVGGPVVLLVPVPVGVFKVNTLALVLVTYDTNDRVVGVMSGKTSRALGDRDPLMLRSAGLTVGVETVANRGVHLMADGQRVEDYLQRRQQAGACTVVLTCVETHYTKWPYESCPDQVALDDQPAVDLQPFFTRCDTPGACPPVPGAGEGIARLPIAIPASLAPGTHRLVATSSTFKGRLQSTLSCDAGQVLYATIRGEVKWHWWGPKSSTLTTSVAYEDSSSRTLRDHLLLLYRDDHWIARPEPDQP